MKKVFILIGLIAVSLIVCLFCPVPILVWLAGVFCGVAIVLIASSGERI